MPRCAIYARFSTELQSAHSAEDQIASCSARAEREGWEVAGVYTDIAISGASNRRPGMTAMLADAAAGSFDIVCAEAIDLYRDLPTGAKVLAHPSLLLMIAAELVDERAVALMELLRTDKKLSATITGHVAVPGLVLASWGFNGPIPAPAGRVILNTHDERSMWQRIRAEEIDVQVLVGIGEAGELRAWTKTVAIAKGDRESVTQALRHASEIHNTITPEQMAEIRRTRAVVSWSRRLAVNALGGAPLFAGTPLEGRTYWPAKDGEQILRNGVQGVLVPVDIFVTDEEIAEQRKAAERRQAEEQVEIERRQAERQAVEGAEQRRWQALFDMQPPAIVVLDGAAWARDDEGRYDSTVDQVEPFDDWQQLLNVAECEGIEVGATFTTREAWEAALSAAEPVGAPST